MQRESFGSRLGFLLVSAGCAIGIGNVWRFPYITGKNGGGYFVLFYLVCLLLLGVPVMAMPDKAAFASRTDPHRPRIHGISSNCATYAASFPRTASL